MHIATMDNPPPIHVDGRAGRGKTYVLYPIIGALRKIDEIVLVSASSRLQRKITLEVEQPIIYMGFLSTNTTLI
jgi:hypothetical protein